LGGFGGCRLGLASAAWEPSTDTPDAASRLSAEERKAILDQRVAVAVASGGQVASWGRGTFETVVSYHRYLPGSGWRYIFPLLLIGIVLMGPATANRFAQLGAVLFVGIVALWAGRTRYERLTVEERGDVSEAGAGLHAGAATVTILVGLFGTVSGGAHFQGVVEAAIRRGYVYDVRLAGLLLLGLTIVFAGVLCLTAVRGLARGQRRAWDRAMIGTLLLILVTAPIYPSPTQGELAGALAFPAAVNVIVLALAWHRLEAA
jgi:hypothetical protein